MVWQQMKVVQVGLVAVAGMDRHDALIGGVVDDLLPSPILGWDVALPPREDGSPSLVVLDLQVVDLGFEGSGSNQISLPASLRIVRLRSWLGPE